MTKVTRFATCICATAIAGCASGSVSAQVAWDPATLAKIYDPSGNIYTYAPSVIVDNGVQHIWTCHNRDSGVIKDYIYYSKRVNGVTQAGTAVLSASTSGWDSVHNCDPTVLRSNVTYKGEPYSYVMFYLGNDVNANAHNAIGVAVAKNIEGPWVKYDKNPIIPFPGSNTSCWGAGQQAATSIDGNGKILLLVKRNTCGTSYTNRMQIDLSNLDSPVLGSELALTTDGWEESGDGTPFFNFDIAYDAIRKRFWAVGEQRPYPTAYPSGIDNTVEVFSLPEANMWNGGGRWRFEAAITPGTTGSPRNHNAGIKRDPFGGLLDQNRLSVVLTDSCADDPGSYVPCNGGAAEWSYDLYEINGAIRSNGVIGSAGFSSTQGLNGWSYQYASGTTFTSMTWDATNSRWIGPDGSIVARYPQRPGSSYDSVRSWTASAPGTVEVGSASASVRVQQGNGDGVRVRILKNTTQIWPSAGWQPISAGGRVTLAPFTTTVSSGDVIRFVVNKNGDATDDETYWFPMVSPQ